jgi:ABC-type phosphate transport system permease subunit
MTGIVAQEMGEVEFGSIHYRALCMVGIALFLIALLVNLLSQNIAGRYKANY